MNAFEQKISSSEDLGKQLELLSRPFVFTNGCFDILHRGHVTYLQEAANLGNSLIVGVNSDASVRKLNKGKGRPFNPLEDRMAILAALEMVDLVVDFDEATPFRLIKLIQPDHLVKGGDWSPDTIVGARETIASGGEVHSIPFKFQISTSNLINRIAASLRRQ